MSCRIGSAKPKPVQRPPSWPVTANRDHDAGIAFRHELAREAEASAISPSRRKTLHAQSLQRLEATLIRSLHLAQLAHHAEEAGDHAAVLRHAPQAARRAAHFCSHREASDAKWS